MEAISYSESKF